MALSEHQPHYADVFSTTPPLSADGSDFTSGTGVTDMSVTTVGAAIEVAAKALAGANMATIGRRRHQRSESQVMVSAQALNELRAKFDHIAAVPRPEVPLDTQMAKFKAGQEEVQLWLGATTVALSSIESGELGSAEDLEGTAALEVSVKRFTVQLESLTELGATIKRRFRLERADDEAAEAIERDCAELDAGWRDLRDRVDVARRLAIEAYERDQETDALVRALDVDVTRTLGNCSASSSTLEALEMRLVELEKRIEEMPPADERIREKLCARVRSVRSTLKGARAAASRRYETFAAVAGQLDGLLTTLRGVATRCLWSLRTCEEHYK
ncbi:hypothetical protein THASP1DRAFT_33844, partial [Thamnocephalis sphaerospora]